MQFKRLNILTYFLLYMCDKKGDWESTLIFNESTYYYGINCGFNCEYIFIQTFVLLLDKSASIYHNIVRRYIRECN